MKHRKMMVAIMVSLNHSKPKVFINCSTEKKVLMEIYIKSSNVESWILLDKTNNREWVKRNGYFDNEMVEFLCEMVKWFVHWCEEVVHGSQPFRWCTSLNERSNRPELWCLWIYRKWITFWILDMGECDWFPVKTIIN